MTPAAMTKMQINSAPMPTNCTLMLSLFTNPNKTLSESLSNRRNRRSTLKSLKKR